jgi:RimJ/RimL family protein N-acetyltransferase
MAKLSAKIRDHKVHVSYVLGRAHWRQEFMSEALQALIEWSFANKAIHI